MQCSICKERKHRKLREGQSCTVVNMEESQNTAQWVKASEVDNVRHAETDYFVRAWIACQCTGLYPNGVELRQKHWDIIFRLSLCFLLGWEKGVSAQISEPQSAFETTSVLRCWIREIFFCIAKVCVLFDFIQLFIMKNKFTGF